MPHSQVIPMFSRINTITGIDNYLFEIYSKYVPHLRLDLPTGLFPVKILKTLLVSSILATFSAYFNHRDLITLAILTERHKE